MKTSFVIGVDGSGIDEMIRGVQAYQRWLNRKTEELKKRLAEFGAQFAELGFASALYDGTNDVKVECQQEGDGYVVYANGEAALFIEFGTGVYNAAHPLEGEIDGVVPRGQYGYGLGKLQSWRYPNVGDNYGTGGVDDPNHKGYIITKGNPANMCMYNSVKELEKEFKQIVSDVFRT